MTDFFIFGSETDAFLSGQAVSNSGRVRKLGGITGVTQINGI